MGPGFESQRDHSCGCALVRMIFVVPLCGPVWAVLLGAWSVLESLEGQWHWWVGMDKIGLVAQLVEQFSLKEWVLGSSPSGTTVVCALFFSANMAAIWGEGIDGAGCFVTDRCFR